MVISPFTPLFFDTRKSDGIPSRYVQTFAPTDRILLEILAASSENVVVSLIDDETDEEFELDLNGYSINPDTDLAFTIITGQAPGYYKVKVGEKVSSVYRITDDERELAKTTLIQYTMHDNRQRSDALFIINGMHHFFDFRVPGGFKDSGWAFGVENEQFVTPEADPIELFALESTNKRFTMGWQEGVPVVFGELLNRLLTCTYVYFDGVRYARKDSSAPEMSVPMEGLDSFVFTQQLQKVNNLNPTIETAHQLIMRRESVDYRTSDGTDNRTI